MRSRNQALTQDTNVNQGPPVISALISSEMRFHEIFLARLSATYCQ